MRKNYKRITAMLMTSAIALSAGMTAVTSFAADPETYAITMSTTTGHTYSAYQIFKGDLNETTSGDPAVTTKTLSNIDWGTGVDSAALITALKDDTTYGTAFTAAIGSKTGNKAAEAVAKQIAEYKDNPTAVKAIAKIIGAHLNGSGTATTTEVEAGYYLIKDTTADTAMPQGNTYSEFMLEVVSDVTVSAKDETVTSDKKVTDVNDSKGESQNNQTSADYDIGDNIPYVLTFTLPSKYAEYSKYPITFTDEMCKGLEFNGDAKIYYGDSDTTGEALAFASEGITSSDAYNGGKKYTSSIADLKTKKPGLTAGTVIRIEYTAKLTSNAVIGSAGNPNKYNVTFANDPTWKPDDDSTTPDTPPTGDTPPSETKVYTYQVVINKTDGTNPLKGADFDLYKFIKDESGADTYEGTKGTWTLITALGSGTDKPTKSEVTDDTTTFTFKGLDDGYYKLKETKTPTGYNSIDDYIFEIKATTNGTVENVTGDPISLAAAPADGKLEGDVVNHAGVTLPGTGGIGTALFYTAGSLLIAGGATLLITKKRMNAKEK